ncbi:MAG: hypothetical protein RIS35_981 [Pseudomonadota bacterium]|jgi:hemolysin activation/secretion protein
MADCRTLNSPCGGKPGSRPRLPRAVAALAGAGALNVLPALAQTPPDAGSLLQQLERERAPALPPPTPPRPRAAPEELRLPAGARIVVRAFRFEGNQRFSDETLAAAVSGALNRPLGFAELKAAAAAVAAVYRDAGWVVRVDLPPQDVTEGIVTLRIVEARFGGVRFDGTPPGRVDPERVTAYFGARQRIGEPLNEHRLARALLLANDLPGVRVTGAMQEGRQDGETDFVLSGSEVPPLSGSVDVDSSGARATGANRVNLALGWSSPTRRGDLLQGLAVRSDGSSYWRTAYSLPLGNDGWRLGVSASGLDYRVTAPELRALGSEGRSDTLGADLTYPWLRTERANAYLTLNADRKRFLNEANGAIQSHYGVSSASIGLSANRLDALGRGGITSGQLIHTRGRTAREASDPGTNPRLSESYAKWRFMLARQQSLAHGLSLHANLTGQHARQDLDSSESLQLGGPGGVRAFPSGEGVGSAGWISSVEVRWQPVGSLTAGVFADTGRVRNFSGGPAYGLSGVGLSVAWQAGNGVSGRAVLARRLSDNPNPTSTGNDQDGSLVLNRLWLSGSFAF